MSPYRRRWRVTARDFPPPSLRQVTVVLTCCLAVAAFLGPLPGIAALVGYFTAQGLVFGVVALVVLIQGFRRSSRARVAVQP